MLRRTVTLRCTSHIDVSPGPCRSLLKDVFLLDNRRAASEAISEFHGSKRLD